MKEESEPECSRLTGGDTVDFIRELGAFMVERKKFWLLPIVAVLSVLSGLIVLTQGSVIAPFIYTIW
jgi:hypothetical protein